MRVVTLLVHKFSMPDKELFRRSSRLYVHSVFDLLERVNLLCHEARPRQGDGTAEVVFSNRSGMNYDDLIESIRTAPFEGSSVRHDQIYSYTSGRRMGLQIADAVASGFFKAVEPTEYG
ncbi:MAG TPA: DUF3800 domain-containing protein, partial [Thermoanaerobaculia bacterium]